MIMYNIQSNDIGYRIRLRNALKHLLMADMEFMEDIDACDYCHSTPMGHSPGCVFSAASNVVYAESLPSSSGLYRALGDLLLADNYLLGTTEYICPYCDEVDDHTIDCVYRRAIEVYTNKYTF